MSSSSALTAASYLEALKELLRGREITYAEIASWLGCSLPTVKRALNKPSLPLDRLLELCDLAGVSFSELHALAEQRRPTHYVFTTEQDALFDEREELLDYFLELAVQGLNPTQIAKEFDLDTTSTDIYLGHLAEAGLLERIGKRQARVVADPPYAFGPDSRVLRKRQQAFMEQVVNEVLEDAPASSAVFLKPLRLTKNDYDHMIGALHDVVDRFSAISERQIGGGQVLAYQIAVAAGPRTEPLPRPLPRIVG